MLAQTYTRHFIKRVNLELRSGGEQHRLIPLIDSALSKLPVYDGEFVYVVVLVQLMKRFPP